MFTRILVPIDFSEPSEAALAYARTIATKFGGTLQLLHVIEDPYRAAYAAEVYVPELAGLREELIADARVRLKATLEPTDFTNLNADFEAMIGTPAWTIVEYAKAHDIDLIVMGTHGRGGVSHLLMGSVAEKVIRTAACPVLTTRGVETITGALPAHEQAVEVPPSMRATSTADRC